VRTFIDFMVDHFERMEYERKWGSFDRAHGRTPIVTART
jgi:hypothetical protein